MKFFSKDLLYKKKEISTEYITDGLILRLDAIDNTSQGHDSSTTTWFDISGNNYNFTINTQNLDWESDGYNINGETYMTCQTSNFNSPQNMTIEVVFTSQDTSTGDIGSIINNRDRNNYNWMVNQYGEKMMFHTRIQNNSSEILESETRYSAVMRFDRSSGTIILNGFVNNQLEVVNDNANFSGNSNYLVIGANSEQGLYEIFYGKIHAIRIYNRPLTNDELTYNYNIDKARFNL